MSMQGVSHQSEHSSMTLGSFRLTVIIIKLEGGEEILLVSCYAFYKKEIYMI